MGAGGGAGACHQLSAALITRTALARKRPVLVVAGAFFAAGALAAGALADGFFAAGFLAAALPLGACRA